jgi:ATP/maltotriose-dependent transcriptional regulator MalT
LTEPSHHDKLTFNMKNESPAHSTTELTEREQEILRLVATGTSNKDIAQQLFISSNTVKVHLRNIFAKINVTTRTEAAMYAVQIGLVKSPAASEQEGGSVKAEGQHPKPRLPKCLCSLALFIAR